MDTVDEIGLRLLILDGGDIRALSQLHILREFMNRIGFARQMDPPPLPCQYFDMIGGAGTGGFVCASPTADTSMTQVFRTFRTQLEAPVDITVAQAVRVTCALPGWFTPTKIGKKVQEREYIACQGSLTNPIKVALKECNDVFGPERRVACILSLGAGETGPIPASLYDKVSTPYQLSQSITSACRMVDEDMCGLFGYTSVYYRFSVDRGLESPEKFEGNNFGDISAHAHVYLSQTRVERDMTNTVGVAEGGTYNTIGSMCQVRGSTRITIHRLPPLTAFFVERPSLMESMTNALFDQPPNTQRIMVVSGMGGSGKTQMVSRFLRAHSERFRHILFVDASSETSIRHSLVQRVRSLGLMYARQTAEEAMQVLSEPDEEISTDWVIIFDNCDNLMVNVSSFFPECDHGFIIVTTRNPQLGSLSPGAHITNPPSESDIRHASAIAKELEYLPVALIQAGAFIKRQRCLHTYLDKLKRNRSNILKRKAMGQRDRHYHCVYDTLEVTYPELTNQCQMFLAFLSFANCSGFSLALVHRAAGSGFRFEPADLLDRDGQFEEAIQTLHEIFVPGMVWDEQFLDDLVEELEQYSLVTRADVYNLPTLRMHCLVSAWAHDRLSEQDKDKYLSAIVRLLISGTNEDNQDMYEFFIPHLDEISTIWGSLHINDRFGVAKVLLHARRIDDSIPLVEYISKEVIERHSQRNLRSIPAFLLESDVYWNTRDLSKRKEAHSIYTETVKILSELVPDDHPLALEALAQRAKRLWWVDLCEEAERMQRHILRQLESSPREDVEFTLRVMKDLALTCAPDQVRKYKEAMELLVSILKTRMEINGKDHWKTLNAEQSLADFYLGVFMRDYEDSYKIGELPDFAAPKEAVILCEGIVKGREERRGPKHPDTLEAKLLLAKVYGAIESDKSILLLKELIEIKTEMLGSRHLKVIELKEFLLTTFMIGRDFSNLFNIVVHQAGQFLDEGNEGLFQICQSMRTQFFRNEDRKAEFIQLLREIFAAKEEVLGLEEPSTIEVAKFLSFCLSIASQHKEAISLWEGMVNLHIRLKPGHPDTEEAQLFLDGLEWLRANDRES
ncbi:hypothetical protein CPB86DRAFT_875976 [Serendipita vermifera]|nr:hypothetical protein CPB86DRAFT_875976 [Serendipita vermifera]